MLVVEFVLAPRLGAAVEDRLRTALEYYFSRLELTMEARHSVFIDEQGRFYMEPTTSFRLTCGEATRALDDRVRAELERAVHGCFVEAGAEPDYLIEWLD